MNGKPRFNWGIPPISQPGAPIASYRRHGGSQLAKGPNPKVIVPAGHFLHPNCPSSSWREVKFWKLMVLAVVGFQLVVNGVTKTDGIKSGYMWLPSNGSWCWRKRKKCVFLCYCRSAQTRRLYTQCTQWRDGTDKNVMQKIWPCQTSLTIQTSSYSSLRGTWKTHKSPSSKQSLPSFTILTQVYGNYRTLTPERRNSETMPLELEPWHR